MKKVALSLIALLAAGTFAFAEDTAAESAAAVSVKLSADAKTKFGIDLDTQKVGFKNEANYDLDLTIVPEADSTKSGTGDVYGTIKIEDVSIAVDNEDGTADDDGTDDSGVYKHDEWFAVGDITAKIVFPNGYFKIYTNTDPKVDYGVDGDDDNGGASIVADDAFYTYKNKYGKDKTEWTLGTLPGNSAFDGTGVSVYYELPSLVGLTFDVATRNGWESGNQWEGAVTVSQKAVEKLTAEVKYYRGTSNYNGELNLSEKDASFDADLADPYIVQAAGVKFAYDVTVAEPFVNVNYFLSAKQSLTEADFGFDVDGDGTIGTTKVTYLDSNGYLEAELGSKLALVDGFKAVIAANYTDKKVDEAFKAINDALGLDDPAANVGAVATFDLAKNKLIGPFSVLAGLRLQNVLSSIEKDSSKTTEVFTKVAFAASETVTVWTKGSLNSSAADDSDSLFVKAGVDYTGIPLTTLGAEYDSSDLGGAKAQGDNKAGQFFVYAKVAY